MPPAAPALRMTSARLLWLAVFVAVLVVCVNGTEEVNHSLDDSHSADLAAMEREIRQIRSQLAGSSGGELGEGQTSEGPLLLGKHVMVATQDGAKPQLAEAAGAPAAEKPASGTEQGEEEKEIADLETTIASMRDEVRKMKMSLSNSVVFEEKAKQLEASVEKKN